jgi:glycosyltransferase involved in cell wall biosynthesis
MLSDANTSRNPSIFVPGKETVREDLFRACFVSSALYQRPLDATHAKKFRAMESLGEIFVLGFANGLLPESFRQGGRFLLLPRLPTPALRYLSLYSLGLAVLLKWIWRDGVTVLVAQGPYEGFVAAIAKQVAGLAGRKVAVVVESHGDFVVSPFLQRRVRFASIYRGFIQFVSRISLNQADALRAVSSSTREQLASWAPQKPIVSFPAWTDMDVFVEAFGREEKNPRLLLFVGVLIPRKAVDRLLDAFARVATRIPEARLHIVGAADDREYARALVDKVESSDLAARVSFFPPMPQCDLAREMTRAAALVLPSLSEGLGRVLFEAMATGTPVIGSRVGGIVDLIDDGETGFLVPAGDVESLAERIEWLLEHPERAREMGRTARECAIGVFSTERYVEEYRKLLSLARERQESNVGSA